VSPTVHTAYEYGLELKVKKVRETASQHGIDLDSNLEVSRLPRTLSGATAEKALLRMARGTGTPPQFDLGFIRNRKPLEILDISTCPLHADSVKRTLLKFKAFLDRTPEQSQGIFRSIRS